MGHSHQITSDGHRIAIGWTFYRMGSVPNFFNGWNLFFKDSINEHRFESFYAHFILFLLCCVIYFPLLTWHFQLSLNIISILSASDVCECCIVLYRNPFCPMAIRCPSDEKYFWCEGAIKAANGLYNINFFAFNIEEVNTSEIHKGVYIIKIFQNKKISMYINHIQVMYPPRLALCEVYEHQYLVLKDGLVCGLFWLNIEIGSKFTYTAVSILRKHPNI